jgi:hypothetical protein
LKHALVASCLALTAFVGAPRMADAQQQAADPFWQGARAILGTLAGATTAAATGYCAKPNAPKVRQGGHLIVESPPRPKPERWLRLRTHRGPADANGMSHWEGPEVPSFVPLTAGNMELDVLDAIPGGYMAMYRKFTGTLGANDPYEVRLYSCSGQSLANLPLNPLMSRRDQLEVQDVRYADRVVYFNEACQSYSRDAGGRCSALVAADPFTGRRLWRTQNLVSNSVFKVVGNYIIAGYGFTAEKDYVRVIRRSDGKVLDQKSMPSSHFELEIRGDVADLEVGGNWASYRMTNFGAGSPKLVPLGTRPATHPAPAAAAPAPVAGWSFPALPALPMWPVTPPAPKPAAPSTAWALPFLPPGLIPMPKR